MKMCRKCLVEKPVIEFHKDSSRSDGLAAYCKVCRSDIHKAYIDADPSRRESRNRRSKDWRKANPERYSESIRAWKVDNAEKKWILDKRSHLWTSYRMTVSEYNALYESQDGACKICNKKKKLVVDHDHSCCPGTRSCGNCVRGLLCHGCNMLVGLIETRSELMDKAMEYISSFE